MLTSSPHAKNGHEKDFAHACRTSWDSIVENLAELVDLDHVTFYHAKALFNLDFFSRMTIIYNLVNVRQSFAEIRPY